MSGRISGGKARRAAAGTQAALLIVISFFSPLGLWLLTLLTLVVLNLGWDAGVEWRALRREAFNFADLAAVMTVPGMRRYSRMVVMRSVPPRLFWVVVVYDHSSRIYMGWGFWSRRFPDFREATTPGVKRRQVALGYNLLYACDYPRSCDFEV